MVKGIKCGHDSISFACRFAQLKCLSMLATLFMALSKLIGL